MGGRRLKIAKSSEMGGERCSRRTGTSKGAQVHLGFRQSDHTTRAQPFLREQTEEGLDRTPESHPLPLDYFSTDSGNTDLKASDGQTGHMQRQEEQENRQRQDKRGQR